MAHPSQEIDAAPAATTEPHWLLTVGAPLGLFVACYVFAIWSELTAKHLHTELIYAEGGLLETAQIVVAAVALGLAVAILRDDRARAQAGLTVWAVMLCLGTFYIVGEETSWGQTFAKWRTPDWLAEINDQQESNIHNISSWFDQKPRLLLELAIVFGGILHPLLCRLRGRGLLDRPWWLMPTGAGLVTAVLAELTIIPGRLVELGVMARSASFELAGRVHEVSFLILRDSELQEMYFYYFILLYVLVLRRRLRAVDG